jgi:hypothetical protein
VQKWFLASQSGTAEIKHSPGNEHFARSIFHCRFSVPAPSGSSTTLERPFRLPFLPSFRVASSFQLFENLLPASARLELLKAELLLSLGRNTDMLGLVGDRKRSIRRTGLKET